jgi:ATP-dependent protease ClpP protease subunit
LADNTKPLDNKIFIWGEIDQECALEWSKQIDQVEVTLLKQAIDFGVQAPLILSVCSPGGETHHSFALADKITRLRVPTVSIIEGYACSGATIVGMAAQKRLMSPNSFMMIHQYWANIWGKHDQLTDYLEGGDKTMERLVEFYTKHSKMKRKEVRKLLRKDKFFNAEECLQLGFVDEIL